MSVSERLASARFFFNLISETEIIRDEEGVNMPNEGDQVSHISCALEDLHQNGMLASAEWQGWEVVITDGSGQKLFSVALGHPYLAYTFPHLN
ncbi:DUF6894 family protein [Microvirga soli]|uniref:DUF6894 family protein n=1 Tax=Microvirga soli TaxID=1854496 RepID=UPI00191C9F3F|nr:hypothetical protein [Microvirga soli]